jgi:DnaJ-class molecular chaperone
MAFPDYYDTLNVPSTATEQDIKTAYRKRALEVHPDRFPDDSPDEKQRKTSKFQSVSDAYYSASSHPFISSLSSLCQRTHHSSSY